MCEFFYYVKKLALLAIILLLYPVGTASAAYVYNVYGGDSFDVTAADWWLKGYAPAEKQSRTKSIYFLCIRVHTLTYITRFLLTFKLIYINFIFN